MSRATISVDVHMTDGVGIEVFEHTGDLEFTAVRIGDATLFLHGDAMTRLRDALNDALLEQEAATKLEATL